MAADLRIGKDARQICIMPGRPRSISRRAPCLSKRRRPMESILLHTRNGIWFEVLSNPDFCGGSASRPREPGPCPHRFAGNGNRPAGPPILSTSMHPGSPDRISHPTSGARVVQARTNAFLPAGYPPSTPTRPWREDRGDVEEVARPSALTADPVPNSSTPSSFRRFLLQKGHPQPCVSRGITAGLRSDYVLGKARPHQRNQQSASGHHADGHVQHPAGSAYACSFRFKPHMDTRIVPHLHCPEAMEERADVVVTDPQSLRNARLDLNDVPGTVRYISDRVKRRRMPRHRRPDREGSLPETGLPPHLRKHGEAGIPVRRPEPPRSSRMFQPWFQRVSLGKTTAQAFLISKKEAP